MHHSISSLETSPVTFVAESPETLNVSRDMFSESFGENQTVVPETPVLPPNPPPMPHISSQFVETQPLTPVRLQGQRWRNWANTRLNHLNPNEIYSDEEVIRNLNPNISEKNKSVEAEEIESTESSIPAPAVGSPKKTITAKNVKEKKRNLAFKVSQEGKAKCLK